MSTIDEQLEALDSQMQTQRERSHAKTANRLAGEMRRIAKAEQRLIPYLNASFRVMVDANALLTPQVGRDVAIEMIGLLESEDRARAFQPDFPEAEYEHAVSWMSACAYDNLAKNVAEMSGYNSEGMHQCINDGIQVCRRTGKLQCVTCFREYATDVYAASDDVEMALHFAHLGLTNDRPGPHDRRWIGAKDLIHLNQLKGNLEASLAAAAQAIELIPTFHTPVDSHCNTYLYMEPLELLTGESLLGRLTPAPFPPPGENPRYELMRDRNTAVREALAGEVDAALARLAKGERLLLQRQCLDEWFRQRLRTLAILRFAGRRDRLPPLTAELIEQATKASDWLTIRLANLIAQDDAPHSPLPTLRDYSIGPFARRPSRPAASTDSGLEPSEVVARADTTDTAASPAPATPAPTGPPTKFLTHCWERLMEALGAEDDDARAALFAETRDRLLAHATSNLSLDEARWLLHTMSYALGESAPVDRIWAWAQAVASEHDTDGTCLNLLAHLGCGLKFASGEDESSIDLDELERLFRRSLEVAPDKWRCFERAGNYFRFQDQLGDAERCFARGFRLARHESGVALPLAEIYNRSDRQRDALAVLDLCLREGGSDPRVAWEASLTAFALEQYESALAYLKRCETGPWVQYYTAAALLELSRPAEARAALEQAPALREQLSFAWTIQWASAMGHAARSEPDSLGRVLAEVLESTWADVDYLSLNGLSRLLRRLWLEWQWLEDANPLKQQLVQRMLETGLSPNEYWATVREKREVEGDLNFYRCLLQQPLDERWWNSPARLCGQESWKSYDVMWGVLARNEEAAAEFVLEQQRRCFPLEPQLLATECIDTNYRDHPGVIWQGFREGSEEANETGEFGEE